MLKQRYQQNVCAENFSPNGLFLILNPQSAEIYERFETISAEILEFLKIISADFFFV